MRRIAGDARAFSGLPTWILDAHLQMHAMWLFDDTQTQVANRRIAMAKYGETAEKKVEKAMRKRKRGTLRSGKSGKIVTGRVQAIAIGLSQARRAGAKVPKQNKSRSKS